MNNPVKRTKSTVLGIMCDRSRGPSKYQKSTFSTKKKKKKKKKRKGPKMGYRISKRTFFYCIHGHLLYIFLLRNELSMF